MRQLLSPFALGVSGLAVVFGISWYNHKRITKRQIDGNYYFSLPSSCEIIVINDYETCEQLVSERLLLPLKEIIEAGDTSKDRVIIGLDCEWKSDNQVALLQITDGHICFLIRTFLLESLPPSLIELLTNPNIIKCGVNIRQDVGLLWRDFGHHSDGVVELAPLAYHFNYTPQGAGLKTLSLNVLDIHNVDKSHHVRCSNWEIQELTLRQIKYAATDAWLSRQVLVHIFHIHGNHNIYDFVVNYFDKKPLWESKFTTSKNNGQNAREKEFKATLRKGILYENVQMLSPENQLLSFLSVKKANWYVNKELAEIVSRDPFVIKLKFVPEAQSNDEFYLTGKQNKCVVCGKEADYMRHSIVPHSYRKLFELQYKSRSSHDIVLLCKSCTAKVTVNNTKERERIAREYNSPLEGTGPKFLINKEISKMAGMASTLITRNAKLPLERINEIKRELSLYLQKDEISDQDIENLAKLETKVENPNHVSHEQMVVNTFKEGDLQKFVFRWRNHFMETMKPQFMPTYWRADRPLDDCNKDVN